MKAKYIIGLILATSAVSNAAVTLTISGVTGAGTGVLTNLASSTGNVSSRKVWGILVDTSGNGFQTGNYVGGFSLNSSVATTLSTSGGATDDVMFLSANLMVNTNNATLDGGTVASGNLARPTLVASVPFASGISQGDAFAIIWFDYTALGGTTTNTDKYGIYTNPGLVIPADGSNTSFASLFLGAEGSVINANNTLVPEPSVALLGAVGALGLLRRRRI